MNNFKDNIGLQLSFRTDPDNIHIIKFNVQTSMFKGKLVQRTKKGTLSRVFLL